MLAARVHCKTMAHAMYLVNIKVLQTSSQYSGKLGE